MQTLSGWSGLVTTPKEFEGVIKVWRVTDLKSVSLSFLSFVDGVQTEAGGVSGSSRQGEPACLPCSQNKLDQRRPMLDCSRMSFQVYFLLTVLF